MTERRIAQINLVVGDVDAVVRLLVGLGVAVDEIPESWAAWEVHHRNLGASGPVDVDVDSAAFASFWGSLPSDFRGAVVNVEADDRDDVDHLFARAVELGAEPCRAPYDAFWGSRFALVTVGSTGIGLRSPVDAAHRSAPPDLEQLG